MRITEELYRQFCRSMPLACVDLIVVDTDRRVLLLLRKNDPARGHWWFPGGRVLYLETRQQAALRKLRDTGLFGNGDCASVAEELLRRALLDPEIAAILADPPRSTTTKDQSRKAAAR